jgi:hypothetical protein
MKIKQHITEQELRAYLQELNIDETVFFSTHRLTKPVAKLHDEIVNHFTNATINGRSIDLKLDEEHSISTANFDKKPFDYTQTGSAKVMVDSINDIIDFHNYAVEQIRSTVRGSEIIFDNLSKKDRAKFQKTMKKAQAQIDKLNTIGATREIEVSDLQKDTLEPIMRARQLSREILSKVEERQKEIENLNNKDQENGQEL